MTIYENFPLKNLDKGNSWKFSPQKSGQGQFMKIFILEKTRYMVSGVLMVIKYVAKLVAIATCKIKNAANP